MARAAMATISLVFALAAAEVPSKANLTDLLRDAEKARSHAVKAMLDNIDHLEDMVQQKRDLGKKEVTFAVNAIEKIAMDSFADASKKANEEFKQRLKGIEDATSATPKEREDMAHRARKAIDEFDAKTEKESSNVMRTMQKDQILAVRLASLDARKAATEALHSAKALERAQRLAGIREEDYEREFDAHEEADERMRDHSQDLFDEGQTLIEGFFDKVEYQLESHWSRFKEESEQRHKSIRDALRKAARAESAVAHKDAISTREQGPTVKATSVKNEPDVKDVFLASQSPVGKDNAVLVLAVVAGLAVVTAVQALVRHRRANPGETPLLD